MSHHEQYPVWYEDTDWDPYVERLDHESARWRALRALGRVALVVAVTFGLLGLAYTTFVLYVLWWP